MSMQNIASFALNNAFNVASNPAAGQAQQAAGSFMTGAQIFAQEASMYPPGSPYQDMLGSTAQIMAGVGQIANVGPILQSYQLRKQQEALLLGGLGGAGPFGKLAARGFPAVVGERAAERRVGGVSRRPANRGRHPARQRGGMAGGISFAVGRRGDYCLARPLFSR